MAHWYTLEEAQADWSGLGVPDAEQMQALLDVSQDECLAFSPVTSTTTSPDPVTLTDGGATVTLTGEADQVTTHVVTSGATASTVVVPADFQPVGTPRMDIDANNRAYFSIGNPAILDIVTNAVQDFTMYWTAATPSAEQDIPDGHRWAHLAHARNIWNAQKVNPSGGLGDDQQGFALTPFPMDWSVRARLRLRVIFGGVVG